MTLERRLQGFLLGELRRCVRNRVCGRSRLNMHTGETMRLETEGRERGPLAELLLLALPTIAQMASYTVMQFGDTWMLSVLGVREPTAAGNAGIFAWTIIGFGFGVLMCVNTLVSQNYGQKDYA